MLLKNIIINQNVIDLNAYFLKINIFLFSSFYIITILNFYFSLFVFDKDAQRQKFTRVAQLHILLLINTHDI